MVLIVTGSLMIIDGIVIGMRNFTILPLPGHVIGLAYGLILLWLGIAKSIRRDGEKDGYSNDMTIRPSFAPAT